MARDQSKTGGKRKPDTGIVCSTCEVSVERKDLLDPQAEKLYHCEGSKVALGCYLHEAHHSTIQWPPCWRCGRPMGCWLCIPGRFVAQENGPPVAMHDGLWCQRCHVAANLETLLAHGVPAGFTMDTGAGQVFFGKLDRHIPNLGEYPTAWKQAYYHICQSRGVSSDASAEEAFNEFRKGLAGLKIKFPGLPSKRKLERERNKQVAAAAEQFQATDADLPERCWDDSAVEGRK